MIKIATVSNVLLRKMREGSFLRSVLTVASGSVIAQAIGVISMPLITRLFTPTDMGTLASVTAVAGVLGVVAAGRYENAVVLPNTDKGSNAVVVAGLIFTFTFAFLITIAVAIFHAPLVELLKLKGAASSWFYVVGLFVALTGLDALLNRVAIRNRHFKVVATTQITSTVSTRSIQLVTGFFFKAGAAGLFIATLFGQLSRVIRLAIGEAKIVFSEANRPTIQDVKYAFKRYKKFPLVSSWAGLTGIASLQMPVILFNALFSPAVAGFYTLGHGVLTMPMSFIGGAVANVFLERAAKAKDNDAELGRITVALYKKLLLIASIAMSFVTFYGDILVPFVFGTKWAEAGKYAQWITLWVVFQFPISPLSSVYGVKEMLGENLAWNIIQLLGQVLAVFIGYKLFNNSLAMIAIFSITNSLLYFFYALRILNIIKVRAMVFWKAVATNSLLIFLIQGLLALFIRQMFGF